MDTAVSILAEVELQLVVIMTLEGVELVQAIVVVLEVTVVVVEEPAVVVLAEVVQTIEANPMIEVVSAEEQVTEEATQEIHKAGVSQDQHNMEATLDLLKVGASQGVIEAGEEAMEEEVETEEATTETKMILPGEVCLEVVVAHHMQAEEAVFQVKEEA